jgi:hypothetical protein
MSTSEQIHFEADLITLKGHAILRLPDEASARLPSRGQVAVVGTVNGQEIRTVIEPDGDMGHWMRLDAQLLGGLNVGPGDRVTVDLSVAKDWPEPDVPEDFMGALAAAPQGVKDKWIDITPMARWEWVRWINETRNPATRVVRIEKTISKLSGKHRRPCCFNLAACTDPELARSGKLVDPAKTRSDSANL